MQNRIRQIREILKDEGVDALLISSPYNIRYVTGFAGFHEYEREGYAFVTPSEIYVLASPLQAEGARNLKGNFETIELSPQKRLLPTLQEIIDKEKIKTVGFEENLTYAEHKKFKKLKVKLKMVEEVVEDVREVKDIDELKSLQEACKLTDAAFSHILKNVRANITELNLAWEAEKYIREHGGELAFPTVVAFGKNTSTPHHVTSDYKLKVNSCILIDFGAKVNGYSADMTRTFFFGDASEKFKDIYNLTLKAQEKSFHPKEFTPNSIDKTARDIIKKGGYNIPHSVGHGVGLQVHELPHISPGFEDELFANTPFTIEPGIYIPGFGGVRIEDTVFYDSKKIVSLTKSPKKLIEL